MAFFLTKCSWSSGCHLWRSCPVGLGQGSIPRKRAIARSPLGHMDMGPCFRPICIPGERVYLWTAPPPGD
ncbi:unnamed protein product [Arabidopsis halleri]